MKIRKKEKQPTAMEKRNTSMVVFAGFALIPLLLTFFLGYSMRNSKEASYDVLVQQLSKSEQERDSILKDKEELKSAIIDLSKVFEKGDSIQESYSTGFSELRSDLRDAISDAEIEAVEEWDEKRTREIKKFERALVDVEPLTKNDNEQIGDIHDIAIKWLKNYSSAVDKEFSSRKRYAENRINQGQQTSDEERLAELEDKLEECEEDVEKLEEDLEDSKKDSGRDQNRLEEDLKKAEDTALEVKDDIISEVDDIRNEIVINMEGQGFLNLASTRQKVNELREKLKIKLDKIESHAKDLD